MPSDTRAIDLHLVRRDTGTELALDPLQSLWTEAQYLRLTDQSNHLIEFTDGDIEILLRPTSRHQEILLRLYDLLRLFIGTRGGHLLVAPVRLRIRAGKFREPDIMVLRNSADPRYQDAYWLGANLVIEVVTPGDRARDTVDKVADYAEAGIPEYWIIDPALGSVSVLAPGADGYAVQQIARRGDIVRSLVLAGFQVDVDQVLLA